MEFSSADPTEARRRARSVLPLTRDEIKYRSWGSMGTSSFSVYLLLADTHTNTHTHIHAHTCGTYATDSPVYAKHNLHYRLINSISDFMMIARHAEMFIYIWMLCIFNKSFDAKFFKYKKLENNVLQFLSLIKYIWTKQ